MSKYMLILYALMLSFSIGCVNTGERIKASLNQECSLQIGQVAQVDEDNLEIRFKKVLEDSRCPKNVTCVWAGRATCQIDFMQSGSTDIITLTVSGLTNEYSRSTYKGYVLSFRLTPYPEAGKEISADAYKLHLIITKQPALTAVLGSIIAQPLAYVSQNITVVGYYRGWDLLHEANTTPPVTRSDWVVKDATGAIYVNANSKASLPDSLLPSSIDATNTVLEVRGVIRVTKAGQPYIDATSIERIP